MLFRSVQAADESIVNVYSVDGRMIRQKVRVENATEGLPKGIYIVGKQKMVVK